MRYARAASSRGLYLSMKSPGCAGGYLLPIKRILPGEVTGDVVRVYLRIGKNRPGIIGGSGKSGSA